MAKHLQRTACEGVQSHSAGVRAAGSRPRGVRAFVHDDGVPRISAFYGIGIEMYFGDHPPPHFHALYAGEEALIVIETGEVYAGSLPTRALRLVREWLELHRSEMQANWELASQLHPTSAIEPLP